MSESLEPRGMFAPGLLSADTWPEMYASLAREQHAVAGIFEG